MTEFDKTDDSVVVVIGSGAGGATVAHELCEKGVKVVVLEAGPRFTIDDFHNNELSAYQQLTWTDKRYATGDWPAATLAPEGPNWIVKAVGGSTVHWNGLSFRAQSHEFKALTTYGEVSGASLADWPVTYDELDPYYSRAEDKMGVTGTHGIKRHPANNNYKVLYTGAQRIGYTQISNARQAINSEFRDGRSACIQMGFCNQGCKMGAKWSTLYSEIPKAEETGNLDLRSGCMVLRIEHDKTGKASGVVYVDANGVEHRQSARIVCVAGNSIETPRLLLNSHSSLFPDGLANSSGEVGRNYTRHVGAIVFGEFDKPVNMHRGITVPGTVFDEARFDPSRGFAGGYLIEAVSLGLTNLAVVGDASGWGRDYTSFLEKYDHLAGVLLNGEDMPRSQNGVSLHDTERDQYGLPVPVIHVEEHENDNAISGHFKGQAEALLDAAGSNKNHHVVTAAATHNMGTCRMSADANKGVVNGFGQTHDVKNLFVSDGSQFTTATAENPTLTIVALAIRQADHIVARMSAKDL